MSSTAVDQERKMERLNELDVLWITAGLGCDGETIAMTAAMQPSIEDVVLGAIPGIPRVKLHNPVLAFETGEDFLRIFHRAAEGEVDPFILVIEGSIPGETNKKASVLAARCPDFQTSSCRL